MSFTVIVCETIFGFSGSTPAAINKNNNTLLHADTRPYSNEGKYLGRKMANNAESRLQRERDSTMKNNYVVKSVLRYVRFQRRKTIALLLDPRYVDFSDEETITFIPNPFLGICIFTDVKQL